MKKPAKTPTKLRIWIKRGKMKRTYVLVAPPFPIKGDEITIQGESGWFVVRTEDASDAIEILFPARAKQVFP